MKIVRSAASRPLTKRIMRRHSRLHPSTFTRNAQRSAASSITLAVGFPPPVACAGFDPDQDRVVSFVHLLQAGGEFEAVAGTTRSSVSAVVTSVAG